MKSDSMSKGQALMDGLQSTKFEIESASEPNLHGGHDGEIQHPRALLCERTEHMKFV
jgi:hypothetical protein